MAIGSEYSDLETSDGEEETQSVLQLRILPGKKYL
jgi:hypothetical protein